MLEQETLNELIEIKQLLEAFISSDGKFKEKLTKEKADKLFPL